MTAAREALEKEDPTLVLHWVRPEDEAEVRRAFERTVAVRKLGSEARELADRYFFETLVRIHRAGEGAPFTGLTEGDPEPIIAAADHALERGSSTELEQELVTAVKVGLAKHFEAAEAARHFRPGDVAAGRAFVAAYVPFSHWVEGVFAATEHTGEHGAEGQGATAEHAHVPPTGAGGEHATTRSAGAAHYLPWILSAVLAIAAFVEGTLLLRRSRHVASGPN